MSISVQRRKLPCDCQDRRNSAKESIGIQIKWRMLAWRRGSDIFIVIQSEPAILTVALGNNAMPLTEFYWLQWTKYGNSVAQIEAQFYVSKK